MCSQVLNSGGIIQLFTRAVFGIGLRVRLHLVVVCHWVAQPGVRLLGEGPRYTHRCPARASGEGFGPMTYLSQTHA